jgi:hypothetical protein
VQTLAKTDNIFYAVVRELFDAKKAFERTFTLLVEDHNRLAEEALALRCVETFVGFSRVSDSLKLLAVGTELCFRERRSY